MPGRTHPQYGPEGAPAHNPAAAQLRSRYVGPGRTRASSRLTCAGRCDHPTRGRPGRGTTEAEAEQP